MSLKEYAKKELTLAGLFEETSDYNGMLGTAVMELVETHSKQGHSGYSHQLTLEIFNRVVNYKPLSAITNSPDEWMDVGENLWQNKRTRQPSLFSTDSGKTYYDLDEEGRPIHTANNVQA
jgi:hypothetical protein